MGTITGLTADAMAAIRNGAITGAEINDDGHLILTHYDGSTTDVGDAKGDKGDTGDPTTFPHMFDPCACGYYLSTPTASNTGLRAIKWDTDLFPAIGGFTRDSAGNITFPVDGIYSITAQVVEDALNKLPAIYLENDTGDYMGYSSSESDGVNLTTVRKQLAGSSMTVQAGNGTGAANWNVSEKFNFVTIHRVA